jgi:hypothetical protein
MSSLYLRGPSLTYSAPGCFNKSDLYALVTYAKTLQIWMVYCRLENRRFELFSAVADNAKKIKPLK